MADIDHIASKSNKTFILVCINFAMLSILFCGLGFVIWQSAQLVLDLKHDLENTKQTVAEIKERVHDLDAEVVIEKVIDSAVKSIQEEVSFAISDSEAMAALADVPERVEATAEAIRLINERIQELDADSIAQRVSYHMLRGMGDGFSEAAESRKPAEPGSQ